MKKTTALAALLATLSIGAAAPAFAASLPSPEPAPQAVSAETDSPDHASSAPDDGFVDDESPSAPSIDEIVAEAKALGVLDEAELAAYRDAESRIAALEEQAAAVEDEESDEACARFDELLDQIDAIEKENEAIYAKLCSAGATDAVELEGAPCQDGGAGRE